MNLKQRNFVKAYQHNVSMVSIEDLINFFEKNPQNRTCDGGEMAHIEDCWQLWNAARNDLELDLVTTIEQLLEYSNNAEVIGSRHEFLISDKLKELGYKWGIIPNKKED